MTFPRPTNRSASAIDMLTPAQACDRLALGEHDLLASVNRGDLAAYDLGEGIRFRTADVQRLADNLVAA